MKYSIALVVALAFSGPSLASDIIGEEHNCIDLQAMVKERGTVVLSGGGRRALVHGSPFACRGKVSSFGRDLTSTPLICPAKDKRFCNVGFRCILDKTDPD